MIRIFSAFQKIRQHNNYYFFESLFSFAERRPCQWWKQSTPWRKNPQHAPPLSDLQRKGTSLRSGQGQQLWGEQQRSSQVLEGGAPQGTCSEFLHTRTSLVKKQPRRRRKKVLFLKTFSSCDVVMNVYCGIFKICEGQFLWIA